MYSIHRQWELCLKCIPKTHSTDQRSHLYLSTIDKDTHLSIQQNSITASSCLFWCRLSLGLDLYLRLMPLRLSLTNKKSLSNQPPVAGDQRWQSKVLSDWPHLCVSTLSAVRTMHHWALHGCKPSTEQQLSQLLQSDERRLVPELG